MKELHELPGKRELIAPEEGWKEHTLYLVHVSYRGSNPIHEAYLEVGFLNDKNDTPGAYSEIWCNNYDSANAYGHAYYLCAVKALYTRE